MTPCPTCQGEKVIRGYACPGFKRIELPCFDCKGLGTVDDIRLVWAKTAETLRAFRQARDLGMTEAARWLGIKPSEWNEAEHSRVDPGPLLARVQRKAMDDAMAPLRQEARDDD